MEIRIFIPIFLGIVSAATLIFAELRLSGRKRMFLALTAAFTLALSVWDFGNLRRRYETHFLCADIGQAFFIIDQLAADGRAADVHSVLTKQGTNWLNTPSPQQIAITVQELLQCQETKK